MPDIDIPFATNLLEPGFEISEKSLPKIAEMKPGQRARTIINYTVIEKTKSFAILRVDYVELMPTRRKF